MAIHKIPLTGQTSSIVVDEELSSTSKNPVQNKIITTRFNEQNNLIEENFNTYTTAMSSLADGSMVVGKARDSNTVGEKTIGDILKNAKLPNPTTEYTNLFAAIFPPNSVYKTSYGLLDIFYAYTSPIKDIEDGEDIFFLEDYTTTYVRLVGYCYTFDKRFKANVIGITNGITSGNNQSKKMKFLYFGKDNETILKDTALMMIAIGIRKEEQEI